MTKKTMMDALAARIAAMMVSEFTSGTSMEQIAVKHGFSRPFVEEFIRLTLIHSTRAGR